MLTRVLKYIILFCIQLFVWQSYGQLTDVNNKAIRDKQRVNYVYNFTKYIDWEGLDERTEFIIGVLGENESNLVNEFEVVARKRTIKGLPVTVKLFSKISEISQIDILYVNNSYGFDLNPILEKLYVSHSLLVTEGYSFHLSMINFIELEDEFHFEINTAKINRAQLLVDPKLLSFSTQSTNEWDKLYRRLKEEMVTVEVQKQELIKLEDEIITQKQELKIQEEKLVKIIDSVKIQRELLATQEENINQQKSDINKQIWQLSALSKRIDLQKVRNSKLKTISKEQAEGITKQNSQIRKQEKTLSSQLVDIKEQSEKINKQGNDLKLQLNEIQQQRVLIGLFIAFAIFAIVFSVFMYRAYKRRKENEAILRVKNKELVDVNKSLDSFTYRVSHDLKAPVTNMKNMISLVKKFVDPKTNEILPDLYKNLDMSASRLDTTIAGMLELTKIERMKENKVECNMLDVVNSLLPEYQSELDNIEASVDLSQMKQNNAFATKAELASIFQNLLTNSIKYRLKERTLEIVIKSELIGKVCLVTYSDNGQGIDLKRFEGKLFSIFERFTTDNSISGSGIGMHSIKKMVENNHGTIELESEPDQGLTYLISFPIYS